MRTLWRRARSLSAHFIPTLRTAFGAVIGGATAFILFLFIFMQPMLPNMYTYIDKFQTLLTGITTLVAAIIAYVSVLVSLWFNEKIKDKDEQRTAYAFSVALYAETHEIAATIQDGSRDISFALEHKRHRDAYDKLLDLFITSEPPPLYTTDWKPFYLLDEKIAEKVHTFIMWTKRCKSLAKVFKNNPRERLANENYLVNSIAVMRKEWPQGEKLLNEILQLLNLEMARIKEPLRRLEKY